ncbi:MAG TPA: rhombotarget lipoprotein [Steroidobacteraceae bacterium]|nr:rhombotarget lipoprotein [Steroidobacteraceae bacterium]
MLGVAAVSLTLGGCAWLFNDLRFDRSSQTSTPLVDFLYTEGKVPEQDAQPELHLPIRVAVSFLPSDSGPRSFQPGAIDREKVLTALRDHFRALPYVSEIVIVPDYYLHSGKGDGLMQIEQLSRLYHFDLFALVSYDQIQNAYQNDRSLAYFTIVGAYFVRGDRNETHTLLDVAVIDPKSRALVMRAGGTSALKGNVTAVDAERHADAQSVRGFELATEQLIANFSRELTDFEQRVRDGTASVKVVRQGAKNGGSGALDPLLLLLLGTLLATGFRGSRGMRSWASVRSSARD